jgi:S-adenosyl methyltransferase
MDGHENRPHPAPRDVDAADVDTTLVGAADVDTTARASIARMYDFILGGSRNLAVDRAAAEQALTQMPDLPRVLRANRAFLARVVRTMVDLGIRQFLDLGSGIPTVGNVHEIAQRHDPSIRVVYVDLDPIAVLTADEVLAGNPNVTMIRADLRHPERVLADGEVRRLIDLSRPVGILLVGVLHLIPDADDPAGILDYLYEAVAPGSYLALSHMSPSERQTPAGMREAQRTYQQSGNPLHPRRSDEIETLLCDWQPEPPGLVACPHWRPDPDTEPLNPDVTFPGYAALTRKPVVSGDGKVASRVVTVRSVLS